MKGELQMNKKNFTLNLMYSTSTEALNLDISYSKDITSVKSIKHFVPYKIIIIASITIVTILFPSILPANLYNLYIDIITLLCDTYTFIINLYNAYLN